MNKAKELCGLHIGKRIKYMKPSGDWVETEEITMITHKKNGWILVRHGRNNRQPQLYPATPFEVLDQSAPVYEARL